MVDIIKKRVIDWDNQLRREKHFNEKFGTNLSPSCVKELTGSFRRLTEKNKIDIHDDVVNLELKRKYQVDITTLKDEHKERVDNLKKMTSDNIQKDLIFSELIKYLDVKV